MAAAPIVRRAVPADAEGIARVHTTTWQSAYRDVLPASFLDGLRWERRAEGWRRELAEGQAAGSAVFVAVAGGEVIGFASTGPARDEDLRQQDFLELHSLYVHPSAWRGGVGRALVDAAFADVTAPGVMLWVLDDNPKARRFYERAGFTPDGVARVETVAGTDLLELRYVKRFG